MTLNYSAYVQSVDGSDIASIICRRAKVHEPMLARLTQMIVAIASLRAWLATN